MGYEIIHTGKVIEGTLTGIPKKELANELKFFEGKSVDLIIRKHKKYRSIYQNRYYWMIITMIGNDIGNTKDEMHDILKFKFLKAEKVDENTGEIFPYIRDSSDLSTVEFEDYLSEIRKFAAEYLHMNIPLPNEQI